MLRASYVTSCNCTCDTEIERLVDRKHFSLDSECPRVASCAGVVVPVNVSVDMPRVGVVG